MRSSADEEIFDFLPVCRLSNLVLRKIGMGVVAVERGSAQAAGRKTTTADTTHHQKQEEKQVSHRSAGGAPHAQVVSE